MELNNKEKQELLSMFNKKDLDSSLIAGIMCKKYLDLNPLDKEFKMRFYNKIKDNDLKNYYLVD